MPDRIDADSSPTPSSRRRSRKFVLPDHHHDEREGERTDDHIEAFLAPPVAPRRRRHKNAGRVRRPVELDTPTDWTAALQREAARHTRYGRPASVLLIELMPRPVTAAPDRLARVMADAIRAGARETDRAVQVDALSFRLLLPETGDRAARAVAARLDRAYLASLDPETPGADLTIDVATPARHATLGDALAEAERRLAVRSAVDGS